MLVECSKCGRNLLTEADEYVVVPTDGYAINCGCATNAIIKKLEAENKILREALEFYADKNNWQSVQVGYGDRSQIKHADIEFCQDGYDIDFAGKLARKTIAQLSAEKEE